MRIPRLRNASDQRESYDAVERVRGLEQCNINMDVHNAAKFHTVLFELFALSNG